MILHFSITTTKNTAATAKKRTIMGIVAGKVTEVSLQFPSGAQGKHHIQIARGLHQLWPLNPEADFATADETIHWFEDFNVLDPPFELYAYTWNTDANFDHTVNVRVVIQKAIDERAFQQTMRALLAT